MDVAKPYKFIGFGDIHGPKPYEFIGFGDLHGTKPYQFIGFGAKPKAETGITLQSAAGIIADFTLFTGIALTGPALFVV